MLCSKQQLRRHYKDLRSSLSQNQVINQSNLILDNVKKLDIWDYKDYHVYLDARNSNLNEVKTDSLIHFLRIQQKRINIPKTVGCKMTAHVFELSTQLELNQWLIPEPINATIIDPKIIEVMFIPMIIGDERGYRVGYGKGYYDRFLVQCFNPIKIGLCFFGPIQQIEDLNQYDQKLNHLVTPDKIYTF